MNSKITIAPEKKTVPLTMTTGGKTHVVQAPLPKPDEPGHSLAYAMTFALAKNKK